ncbi:hypothetical protein F5148DRAFT_1225040 [Russula earlei]|uniref:Uncharacterized protein n=1 Tax=Russula earlei TaxID=71964 RepID=A0ACC0U082_9AGAM|nr:hypothetical protein F5148DRAFT_1225040 [Russula earlei]
MKSYLFSLLSAALFVAGVSAQLTVNTPTNVISCTTTQITFTGGTAPYILSVHAGSDPNGAPLQTYSGITGSPFVWTADNVTFATGTSLDITLRDSSGLISQTAPFTIQAGGSTSCLTGSTPASASSPASSSAGTGSTSAGSASSSSAGSPATTKPAASSVSGQSQSSASSPSSSTSTPRPNGAMPISVPYGAAGVLGAVIAAVFA